MSVIIRIVTDDSLISRIIRCGEMGFRWSHVECLTPDNTLLGAHADGGVQARKLGYDGADKGVLETYWVIPCPPVKEDAFHAYLRLQVGKPYDMEAIKEMAEGSLLGKEGLPETTDSFICSALLAAALQHAGLVNTPFWSTRLTTPRDIFTVCSALGHPIQGKPRA